MNVEWRHINGYDGYMVSNTGIIRSFKRNKPCDLRYVTKPDGYLRVYLCRDGKKKAFYVHRVVAKAFIDNPMNLPFINHKDECKTNNNADNLEWCTQKYNVNYGTCIKRREAHINKKELAKKIDLYTVLKKRNGKNKHKPVQQFKDDVLIATYDSTADAARKTGLWQQSISRVACGKLNQTGGYQWKYVEEMI